MTVAPATVKATEVRLGDRLRTRSGAELTVTRIDADFMGRADMLAFVEDSEEQWFKMPALRDSDVATAASELGYAHIAVFDHVVGADPAVHRGWSGPYDVHTTFHEPFVLFGYLAALTSLELVTSIMILPQRQTVLVAKQAAEIDLLTLGKFRLGVGLGWNEVEYEALGQNFSDRGARLTEQVALLRRLWTETSVTVAGDREHVTGAGIAPLPVQRPIAGLRLLNFHRPDPRLDRSSRGRCAPAGR